MKRINKIVDHLQDDDDDDDEKSNSLCMKLCIGEMENRQVDPELENNHSDDNGEKQSKSQSKSSIFKYRFVRKTLKIVFQDESAADERYGGNGDVAILEGELIKPPTESDTVFIFMHPSGIQNLLPMPVAMARSGLHVITCCSRYPNNDSCLIMEKVVIDLGACIRHAKTKLGYKKVILCGWSGGGSLTSFYQSQAEHPTITKTPAGDLVDLTKANLIPADVVLILAAHISRAQIFTEWLDPSVLDENDISKRDPTLDIFNPGNPNKPPYSKEFVQRYRKAQVERNRKITQWAKEQLSELENIQAGNPNDWKMSMRDKPFTVHCTQADLRRLDLTLDPNGREETQIKDLAAENHSPVGLARFSTLRSWLSQWSIDETRANALECLKTVKAPVFVLANEADHLVPLSHPKAMFDAISHDNKKHVVIKGATHYYFGQSDLMAEAIQTITDWLNDSCGIQVLN